MGIHEVGNLLSLDCISGDGTTMELDLDRSRIVIRNDTETLATIELDQERIDWLRAYLRGERR